jgi:hypothetical protein
MPDKEDRCHALLQAARDDAEGLRRELSLERKRAYLAIASHTPSLAEQCNREAGQCRGPPDSILEGEVRHTHTHTQNTFYSMCPLLCEAGALAFENLSEG